MAKADLREDSRIWVYIFGGPAKLHKKGNTYSIRMQKQNIFLTYI